ncbi:MAG: hypothetical protein WDA29_09840 [Flavobacteriaceae bacterium]
MEKETQTNKENPNYKGIPVPVLKSSDGRASTSFTITVVSFGLVALHYLAWIIGTALGYEIPAFDATEVTLFLGSAYTLYFARRWASEKNKTTDKDLTCQDE